MTTAPASSPPDLDALDARVERLALLSFIMDGEIPLAVILRLQPGHFRDSRNGTIYGAIRKVIAEGGRPDIDPITARLDRDGTFEAAGGLDYLEVIVREPPDGLEDPAQRYAEAVICLHRARRAEAEMRRERQMARWLAGGSS